MNKYLDENGLRILKDLIKSDIEGATQISALRLFRTERTITVNITNGSYSGATSVWSEEAAIVTVSAAAHYILPNAITVSGADYVYDSNTGVIGLRNATSDITITVVCAEAPLAKGEIISFDALGDGTQKRFRVIDIIEGNTVKLLGLSDVSSSATYNTYSRTVTFDNGASYQNYESSSLDNLLNNTYYNSLSSDVQSAIVDETVVQSCWDFKNSSWGSDDFIIERLGGSLRYCKRVTQRTVGSRHVHVLDVDEIAAYLGAGGGNTVLSADLLEMYFEQRTTISKYVWCASAYSSSKTSAVFFTGSSGYFDYEDYSTPRIARPVFKINLSTINYTREI